MAMPNSSDAINLRSDNSRVRKVKVDMVRDRERKTYLRPIKELVLLLSHPVYSDQQ